MARPMTHKTKQLYKKWLILWQPASPRTLTDDHSFVVLRRYDDTPRMSFGCSDISIEFSGASIKERNGKRASLLRVDFKGHTITPLLAKLLKLELHSGCLVAISSGIDVHEDIETLARQMVQLTINAALICLEPTALDGLTGHRVEVARKEIEDELVSRQNAQPGSVHVSHIRHEGMACL